MIDWLLCTYSAPIPHKETAPQFPNLWHPNKPPTTPVMKPQFFLPFLPLPFNIITTKRWQVANKETLLQHSWALQPSWLSQSTWPSWLTQHYQDYDVNYDNRAAYSCSHSICFLIQCSLQWPALLSLLSFYQHSSIPKLSLSGFSSFLHCANCHLYSLVITQQVMCALFSIFNFTLHHYLSPLLHLTTSHSACSISLTCEW